MTASEQQALAQARARIESNMSEIASLARDGRIPPAEFFQRFLDLTLGSVDAMGGAVWSVDQGQAHRVAEVSFASSGYESPRQKTWVDNVLSHTVATSKSCVVAVQDQSPDRENAVGNEVPYPFFYTPVVLDGQTRLVVQLWLKQAGDPRHYADIAAFLEGLVQHACLYVRGVQQKVFLQRDSAARNMLKMHEEILGELDPKVLQAVVANYLVDLLPCHLAAVFRLKGKKWQVMAASNQEVVDPQAAQSQALAVLASKLPERTEGGVFPDPSSPVDPAGDLARALGESGYAAVAWCHLRPSKNAPPSVMLLGCWHETPADAAMARGTMCWSASQLARAMDAATHFQHIPFRPLASAFGRVLRAWNDNRRRKVVTWVLAPALLAAGALLYPAPYKVKADCQVVPARTATVVAETNGKVLEVLAPEGASVKAGEVLARLDDSDYAIQLAVSAQQLSRLRVETARAQALGNEPERKIAELSARREEENIRRLEYLRSRTQLRSPIDGTVLTRNVHHREGEAMETGKVFCEVGSLGAYELQIDLRQQDLGSVLSALGSGRSLPVDFILHAHSRNALRGELSGVGQVSQLPEMREIQTVFTARVPFPAEALEGGLKAGYTGKASILLGRRPWGWILLQPFRQYWRMNWSL